MSHILTAAVGILFGLALAGPRRRKLIAYSMSGTPPQPYIGPRMYTWADATARERP
jgi:hypothetical protein